MTSFQIFGSDIIGLECFSLIVRRIFPADTFFGKWHHGHKSDQGDRAWRIVRIGVVHARNMDIYVRPEHFVQGPGKVVVEKLAIALLLDAGGIVHSFHARIHPQLAAAVGEGDDSNQVRIDIARHGSKNAIVLVETEIMVVAPEKFENTRLIRVHVKHIDEI